MFHGYADSTLPADCEGIGSQTETERSGKEKERTLSSCGALAGVSRKRDGRVAKGKEEEGEDEIGVGDGEERD